MATISRKESRDTEQNQTQVKIKLNSCGSVFIAHANHLIRVKSAKPYGLQNIRLLGIGEKTNYLTEEMRKRSSCWASTPWWKRALTYFNTWKIHSRGIACNSLFGLRERHSTKYWKSYPSMIVLFKVKLRVHPRDVYIGTTEYDEVTGHTSERKSYFIHFRGNSFYTTLHYTSEAS